jgi:hypothetical protein
MKASAAKCGRSARIATRLAPPSSLPSCQSLARADRRSHHRRRHRRPSGAQRPSHRDAWGVHVQETQFSTGGKQRIIVGRQPGQFAGRLGLRKGICELVPDQPAATAGKDRRTSGQTCALLLATTGGRTSEPAAIRGDAGADRTTAGTDRIDGGQVLHRNWFTAGWGKERCRKSGPPMAQFRPVLVRNVVP